MARKTDPLRQYAEVGGKRLVEAIKRVEKINASYAKRYHVKKRGNLPWHSPGGVIAVKPYERGVHLTCEHGWIELHWVAPDCVRVRLRLIDGDFLPPFSYAVHKVDWARVPFELSDEARILTMRSSALVCRADKRRFRLRFELPEGQVITMESGGIQWRETGEIRLTVAMRPNEGCYGLGLRAAPLNLRGRKLQFWNVSQPVIERDTDPLSLNVPFYLGVSEQLAYGIFWDNASRGSVDLGATSENELTFEAEGGELRYYVFGGGTIQSVLSRYTELTGRTYLPARWQLGYVSAVPTTGEAVHKPDIPCEALYLNAPPNPGAQRLDAAELVKFKRMVSELHAQSLRAIAVLTPGISEDAAQENAELVLKYPDGKPALGVQWGGACEFVDFSNPAARVWWGEHVKTLLDAGVDGFALDLAEPRVFTASGKSDALPDTVIHANDGITGNHRDSRNTYALLMARATHDAFAKYAPERRVVCAGSAGFSGIAPYSAVWIDHLPAEWDSIRLSISMALNLSLSGIALVGMDVGGNDGDAELYARWMQAVSLFPLLRSSRSDDTFAPIQRESLQLRSRLLPYLYTQIALNREYGIPILRPLLMAEPDNPALRAAADSYLLGESLLVAPLLEKDATGRTVYLPVGTWYDFWTHETYVGGNTFITAATQDRLPLFVRAGAVLPMWEDLPRASSQPAELILRVYPGEAETILYEDSGDGLDYTQGDYRWVYLTCRWEDDVHLVISRRVAGRYSPTYRNIRVEVIGFEVEPSEVKVDRRGAPIWFYDDGMVEITADDSFTQIEITRQSKPDDDTVSRRAKP